MIERMVEDTLDSFEGPTTIRIFVSLLVLFAMLLFLGTVLAELYGIHSFRLSCDRSPKIQCGC